MQYKLVKIILILVNIYSVSFARGGHGGGGHGGGHSHGSHTSLARSSSTFGHNNRSLISSNRGSNTSILKVLIRLLLSIMMGTVVLIFFQ